MPSNLSPELLAQIQALLAQPGGGVPQIGGTYYQPQYTGQTTGMDASPGTLEAINAYTPDQNHVGGSYEMYDPSGAYQKTGQQQEVNWKKDLMTALAGGAAMAFGMPMLMGGGGAAGAAGAAGLSGAGDVSGMYGGSAGQGATNAYVDSVAGNTAAGLNGTSLLNSASQNAVTPGATPPAVTPGGSGPLSSLGSGASALGGLLGDNAKWLAPLLGAALGSQKTTTGTETVKKMDPRMDALVYGDGGFLNNATDWYKNNKSGMNDAMRSAIAQNRSLLTDPATAQGYKNIASTGQSLLSRPMAENPFTSATRPQFGTSLLQQYLGQRNALL